MATLLILPACCFCFFINYTPTTEIYTTANTLSLHDALPISQLRELQVLHLEARTRGARRRFKVKDRSEEHTSELQSLAVISYAGFCLNKKKYHFDNSEIIYFAILLSVEKIT